MCEVDELGVMEPTKPMGGIHDSGYRITCLMTIQRNLIFFHGSLYGNMKWSPVRDFTYFGNTPSDRRDVRHQCLSLTR